MRKAPIELQDLRQTDIREGEGRTGMRDSGACSCTSASWKRYAKHMRWPSRNDGSPGIDGVTSRKRIEAGGVERFIGQIREELVTGEYLPLRNRRQEIPKDGGKVRVLGIPAIRDRVVQGALKLIVEPIFEADFQAGSYGYRPRRSAHAAVKRVAEAIVSNKTRVIDVDLEQLL